MQALARVREDQALLGAREADVEQAPLLLDAALAFALRFHHGARVRQELLLDAGDEHDLVLEALGRVQRHHRDLVAAVLEVVGVADERDLLQEPAQRARRRRGRGQCGQRGLAALDHAGRALAIEFLGVRAQLVDVGLAIDARGILHLAHPGIVIDLVEHLVDRQRGFLVGEQREARHELGEVLQRRARLAAR